MVMAKFVEVHLVAYKGETLAESHDEVLDTVDYILLNYTFVNFFVTHSELLNVDKVKKILVLKHPDSVEGLFVFGDGLHEVVWQSALIMKQILLLDYRRQSLGGRFVVMAISYVKQAFVEVLGVIYNSNMMCKTDT